MKYVIEFKQLANGKYSYEWNVGHDLFDAIEDAVVSDGNLVARVDMVKSDHMLKLHFDIEGTIRAVCDVCLDEFDYPIEDCGGDIVVKFGDKAEEVSEELYVIDRNDNEISVAQWIYEFIAVSMPIPVEHPLDEEGNSTCNPEMLACLDKYLVTEKTEQDDDTNEATETDPRWDALKGLIK